MSRRARALTTTALLAAALAVGSSAASGPATAGGPTAQQREQARDLRAAKRASVRFHDVRAAVAAGYQPTEECVAIPTGAMGYHYLKVENIGSTDPSRPAVLLYAPRRGGGVQLAGVEWVVPDRDQDLGTDEDRPSMFGGQRFDGPMEGHVDEMPRHYDLHVWLWNDNPDGLFTPWNTSFTC